MKKILSLLLVSVFLLAGCATGLDPVLMETSLKPLEANHLKLLPNEPDEMKREDVKALWKQTMAHIEKAKGGE